MAKSTFFSFLERQAGPAADAIEAVIISGGLQTSPPQLFAEWPLSLVRSNSDEGEDFQWITVRYEGGTVVRLLARNVGEQWEVWELVRAVVRYRPALDQRMPKVKLDLGIEDLHAVRQAMPWRGLELKNIPVPIEEWVPGFRGPEWPLEEAAFFCRLQAQFAEANEARRLRREAEEFRFASESFAEFLAECEGSSMASAFVDAGMNSFMPAERRGDVVRRAEV